MIDVINLQKSFGDKEILKGINVTINKGDIVAVLGPSGSGKSTFLWTSVRRIIGIMVAMRKNMLTAHYSDA